LRVRPVAPREAGRLAARPRGRHVALQLEHAPLRVVPGHREPESRIVAVGHGGRPELLVVGLVEGAPPVALSLEQVLEQVERALLTARIALTVAEAVTERVLV